MFSTPWIVSLAGDSAAFAAIALAYLGLCVLYRSKFLPRWLGGDVVTQLICVALTAGAAVAVMGIYTGATNMPFGGFGDFTIATGILALAAVIAYALYRVLNGLVPRQQA